MNKFAYDLGYIMAKQANPLNGPLSQTPAPKPKPAPVPAPAPVQPNTGGMLSQVAGKAKDMAVDAVNRQVQPAVELGNRAWSAQTQPVVDAMRAAPGGGSPLRSFRRNEAGNPVMADRRSWWRGPEEGESFVNWLTR